MPLSILLVQGIIVLMGVSNVLDLREQTLLKQTRSLKQFLVFFMFGEAFIFLIGMGVILIEISLGHVKDPSVYGISITTAPLDSFTGKFDIGTTLFTLFGFIIGFNQIIQRVRSAKHVQTPAEH